MAEGRLQRTRDNYPEGVPAFGMTTALDAAEMLFLVLANVNGGAANVNGGDWERQNPEWQAAAARARDMYHAALRRELVGSPVPSLAAPAPTVPPAVTHPSQVAEKDDIPPWSRCCSSNIVCSHCGMFACQVQARADG